MKWHIRVDTGGTFTDCWAWTESATRGRDTRRLKLLSSGHLQLKVEKASTCRKTFRAQLPFDWELPKDFFAGFRNIGGTGEATCVSSTPSGELSFDLPLAEADRLSLYTGEEAPVVGARLITTTPLATAFPALDFRLATTRATNALLERKGTPTVLFITEGFRDLPIIRDQRRNDLFAKQHHREAPIADLIIEVPERIDSEGIVRKELQFTDEFLTTVQSARASGYTVAAVTLVHSYKHPQHERELAEWLRAEGFSTIGLSSEICPFEKLVPRLETASINSYLTPVLKTFFHDVGQALFDGTAEKDQTFWALNSSGGLELAEEFQPKDSLLSGPAGGLIGAAETGKTAGYEKLITFDMGGTSTDVSRFDGNFPYQFTQTVGAASILSPSLRIETVASGGGSICAYDAETGIRVGPESAGAYPGPACYGNGGPLTITDVNVLLGRIHPDFFGIPLSSSQLQACEEAAIALQRKVGIENPKPDEDFLRGLLHISIEQMANAIQAVSTREGIALDDYAIVAYGGGGPLHACAVADQLGIRTIIVPRQAGILSATGLDKACLEHTEERQVNLPVDSEKLPLIAQDLQEESMQQIRQRGAKPILKELLAEVRLSGQDSTLTLSLRDLTETRKVFCEDYQSIFGYAPATDAELEVCTLRAIASSQPVQVEIPETDDISAEAGSDTADSFHGRPFFHRAALPAVLNGPAVVQDSFSTLFIDDGWSASHQTGSEDLILTRNAPAARSLETTTKVVQNQLFRSRFDQVVLEMGIQLQRTALSTNVKERADFSCALLSADGQLVTSAPHIPVHLGALGECVRRVTAELPPLQPGDAVITNHPGVGGSHLPDVTVITPIFCPSVGSLIAYVANRAHHSEIGGITPGSMPAGASRLVEEGVLIKPQLILSRGENQFPQIEKILTSSPFPSRDVKANLADFNAQLAANQLGLSMVSELIRSFGSEEVAEQMESQLTLSEQAIRHRLKDEKTREQKHVVEKLDDGAEIHVTKSYTEEGELTIDFTGTSLTHPANFHATPAIVTSALLYSIRLWLDTDIPLNEGALRALRIQLPTCFLNPNFSGSDERLPAVVAGNVETSQRIVDALIRLFEIQACSQGSMNNFIFGNDTFGYYETICGGSGAGDGYHGTSAIHTHMTNTAITDPEILENRFPILLREFSIAKDTGGYGRWTGGDGCVREFEFTEAVSLSLLTQHRVESPFGLAGGHAGKRGQQYLNGQQMPGCFTAEANAGDVLRIETPGGGGYGEAE